MSLRLWLLLNGKVSILLHKREKFCLWDLYYLQKKKEEEKAKDKELNELFKVAVSQPKVPVGKWLCSLFNDQLIDVFDAYVLLELRYDIMLNGYVFRCWSQVYTMWVL